MKKILKKFSRLLPDKIFICLKYFLVFKKKIDLKNPVSFNEKLQYLKLNDFDEIYTNLVDKYEVKKYISNRIGDEYIIPTLGIYDSWDEIDFDTLPNQFVIKCTHDSGGIAICRNKKDFDFEKAKKDINASLKNNYYYSNREKPYKNVKPRILIEKYMEDKKTGQLIDYKFFAFDGNVQFMFVATDRNIHDTKFNFYDKDFNFINVKQHYPISNKDIEKPKNYDKMIELSEILSKGIKHVRVDWYEINGKLYFGELTFYHFGGFVPFEPERYDIEFGKYIKL